MTRSPFSSHSNGTSATPSASASDVCIAADHVPTSYTTRVRSGSSPWLAVWLTTSTSASVASSSSARTIRVEPCQTWEMPSAPSIESRRAAGLAGPVVDLVVDVVASRRGRLASDSARRGRCRPHRPHRPRLTSSTSFDFLLGRCRRRSRRRGQALRSFTAAILADGDCRSGATWIRIGAPSSVTLRDDRHADARPQPRPRTRPRHRGRRAGRRPLDGPGRQERRRRRRGRRHAPRARRRSPMDGIVIIGEGEKDEAPDALQRRGRRRRHAASSATSPSTRSTAPRSPPSAAATPSPSSP